MAIKKIIPREIQQIFVIATVVFCFFLFIGANWLHKRHNAAMQDVLAQRRRVELENKVANQLHKLKQIRENITVINESSRFLAEIAKIAGQLNMKITSISAIPIEKRPEFIQLGVSLEIDTTYHEVGLFVSKLESSEVFITVERLEISSNLSKENAKNPKVMAKMLLTTFALTDTILEK
jgi:Tfp pilus assembly protein PilO